MISPTEFLLTVDTEPGVATVTLNRPERLNAVTCAEAQIQAALMLYPEFRVAYEAFRDKRDASCGLHARFQTAVARPLSFGRASYATFRVPMSEVKN
jgi:hypothetical protein